MGIENVVLTGLQIVFGSGSLYFAGNNAIKMAAITMAITFIIGAVRSRYEKD